MLECAWENSRIKPSLKAHLVAQLRKPISQLNKMYEYQDNKLLDIFSLFCLEFGEMSCKRLSGVASKTTSARLSQR